jgi:nucleotide-binding universal stress UspA family protein
MDYKTILVHLDASSRSTERLEVAMRFALQFGAHLTGLYAARLRELPSNVRVDGSLLLTEEWRQLHRERATRVADEFRAHTARAGLDSAEARIVERDAVAAVELHARYADLVVVGQPDPDEDHGVLGVPADFAERVVESIPRPALIVPYAGSFPRIGQRVLVGWDTSRSAARAIADALPLLKRAANVTVLVVNPEQTGDHGDLPGADIALYLARHGVKVEAMENHTRDVDPGTWIVSRAFDLDADLLVMGGFGHTRLRELVFGGVTRSVLGQAPLPVLIEN